MFKEFTISAAYGYKKEKLFNREANIVASAYAQYLRSLLFETGEKTRIDIVTCERIDGHALVRSGDLLMQKVIFDFSEYWSLDSYRRKVHLLDFARKELIKLASTNHWDTEKIMSAYKSVFENGIVYQGAWDKPIILDLDLKAEIWFKVDEHAANIFLVISDGDDNVKRRHLLLKIWPNDMYLSRLFGDLRRSENVVILSPVDRSFEIQLNLETEAVQVVGILPKWCSERP